MALVICLISDCCISCNVRKPFNLSHLYNLNSILACFYHGLKFFFVDLLIPVRFGQIAGILIRVATSLLSYGNSFRTLRVNQQDRVKHYGLL